MASRTDALRRYRAFKSGFVVLLSKWTVFPRRPKCEGKKIDSLHRVCDEKTVCRNAKSVKGQPLEAVRTVLENLSLRAYRVREGQAVHGRQGLSGPSQKKSGQCPLERLVGNIDIRGNLNAIIRI